MHTKRFLFAMLLGIVATHGVAAGDPNSALALRNGTVVVGDGRVLQEATVLVRGDTIVAVGPEVSVPGDARVVDLHGSVVYPGLIDALSESGGAGPESDDQVGPDGGGFFAHVRAADSIPQTADSYAGWRDGGVLALHVTPQRGIFTGQGAVITTGAAKTPPAVIRAEVAQHVVLRNLSVPRQPGMPVPGGIFPGSLITVWAHLRQTILDAQHYARAADLPAGERKGLTWPETERTLESLRNVALGQQALVLPGKARREVQRIVDFADEIGVRCIVAGGYEAAALAAELNDRQFPVLVSLNFPKPPKTSSSGESVQAMAFRRHAPRSAAELFAAGVPFAFYSDGLKSGAEFVSGMRQAVRHGLPREAAIAAATLSTARILGVDKQIGSIEPGKIANLIVTDGDLLDDGARITQVIAAGQLIAPHSNAGPQPIADTSPVEVAAVLEDAGEVELLPLAPRELLIAHANVMTVTGGTLADASILVRDGKIAAVGTDLAAGPGAFTVDATGKWVTSGFIDTHAHIATDSHNDATVVDTAMARIGDMIDPTDVKIYRVLSGGVTTSNLLHGSVNPIGGQSAVIKMRWGRPAHELMFQGAAPSLKLALGKNPKYRGTDPAPGAERRYPASRMGIPDVIRKEFLEAQRYRADWTEYERLAAAGRASALPPRRDLRLEPLAEILEGRRIIHVHCYRSDEMTMLMRLGDELGFKPNVLHHAAEAYKVAPEIARRGLSVAGFDMLATKVESWDGIPNNGVILTRHGVSYSIGTDSPAAAAHMNLEAARLFDRGLSEEEALAVITINPARQLGIDSRVGSIEVGKDADLVIFPTNPLSAYARPEMVFIDGQLYFSRERDRQRQQRLEAVRDRLTALDEAERNATPRPKVSGLEPADPRGAG